MSQTCSMLFLRVPEEDVYEFDALMRDMGFVHREHLLSIMILTFRAMRDRTAQRDQLGFLGSDGVFQTLDIHNMNVHIKDEFTILPYTPPEPREPVQTPPVFTASGSL